MNPKFIFVCLFSYIIVSLNIAKGDSAYVYHAPVLAGACTVDGSIQQMQPESVNINGGMVIKGDLLIPGTPSVVLIGNPTYSGTVDGTGSAQPSNHQVIINGNASLRHVIRRTDASALAAVPAPVASKGTRSVTITAPNQTIGDPSTLLNLTVNDNAGLIAIPAGTYGGFVANGNSGFTFGVAGATQPSVYTLEHLTVNGNARVNVVGPVVLNIASGFTANGNVGIAATPGWLKVNVYTGGITLNGVAAFYGSLSAPTSSVNINGSSQLIGSLSCFQLTLNGASLLRIVSSTPVNQPPTVAMTAPANNAVFTAPASITLTATATDSDGTIAKVEFFNGSTLLGTATSAPYQFSWTNVTAGSYTLTAKATDNLGGAATSSPIAIQVVRPNVPPTVALTAPASGTVFAAPASIAITATATDSDGTVAIVEFYNGTTLLGTSTSAPYQFSWANVAAGAYALTAKATDNLGAATTSAPVNITVDAPPIITFTSPSSGAKFVAPAAISLVAAATDSDGSVAKVEFYQGGTPLGTVTSAPYQFAWNNVTAGNYSVTAKAYDNAGASTLSSAITINVYGPPTVVLTAPANSAIFNAPANVALTAAATVPSGTVAKVEYFQGGTKIGESTASPYAFTWTNVAAGVYTLTAKVTDGLGATATSAPVAITVDSLPTVTLTAPANNANFTAPATVALSASASDSDGSIAKVEFYQGSTLLGTATSAPYQFSWANVVVGSYALTAKATDNLGGATTSSPVAIQVAKPNVPPTVSLTAPVDGTVFPAPASITLSATAADSDGTVAKVEFFDGTTKLGEATSAPYQYVWPNVARGSYVLTAKATDNAGAATTSASVAITVNGQPTATPLSLSTPAGSSLAVTLAGSDPEGVALTYAIVSGPAHGALAGTAPALTYAPTAGYSGSDSFTYTVSDQYWTSAPATVAIQVQLAVVPPTAGAAQAEVQVGASVSITLNGADAQGLPLTFSIASPPTLGTMQMVSAAGQTSQWTYNAGSTAGVDKFTFTVSNGQQTSTAAAIKVRVVPVPPVADGTSGKAGGIVRDALTLQPLEGVVVQVRDTAGAILTGADGQFMIPVIQFGGETAKMIVVEYEALGYIPAYRRLIAYPDVPVTTDPVFLKKYDSKVTTIGSVGGTATNAAGDVQADFPVGAVSGSLPVQLTNYAFGRELPGHLPKSSAFTYAVDLAPNGATFSSPVTVRIANVLGFAPSTSVPVGVFNPQTVRWEPESMGTISADGQWVVCQVSHFSSRDCNSPGTPGPVYIDNDQTNPDDDSDDIQTDPGVSVAQGTYEADIDLPSYRSLGHEHAIKLRYESQAAAGSRPVTVKTTSSRNTASPLARTFNIGVVGHNYQTTFHGEPWNVYGSFLGGAAVDLHDMPSGLYPCTLSITNFYTSTYGSASVFGGSPQADLGVPTREALAYTASAVRWLPWVNASDSPYGAGWSIEGLSRLYFSAGSNQVMLSSGGADWQTFQRTFGLEVSTNQVGPFTKSSLFSLRKDYAGGLLIAHGDGISRMDVNQQLSVVVDGVKGSRYVNLGSGGTMVAPGGIVDIAEAESGSIYLITRIDTPDATSPLQTTGLFRLDPNSTTFVPVATDLVAPTEVQLDHFSRIYVYDDADHSIWRYNSGGQREQIVTNINYFHGMTFDESANRLFFVSEAGLQYVSGDDRVATFATDIDMSSVFQLSRPQVSENGNIQIYGYDAINAQSTIFSFTAHGVLVQRQPTGMTWGYRWEVTRLGKAWILNDYVNLDANSGGGIPNAVTIANKVKTFASSTSAADVFLVELLDLGALHAYKHHGLRDEEITQTSVGWQLDNTIGTISDYSLDGLLLDVKDRNGNATTYTYDSQKRLLKITDPVGAITAFTYSGNGKLASIVDPAGRSTSFQIDGLGNLVSVTLPDGSVHNYTYDINRHIIKKTDGLGQAMSFTVNQQGVYSQVTYADHTTTGFQAQRPGALGAADPVAGVNRGYDTNLPIGVSAETPDGVTDSNGNRSNFILDERGYPLTQTDALGNRTITVRDGFDRIISKIDARGSSTGFVYDDAGNLITLVDAAHAVSQFEYDALLNLPLQAVDPRGNITKFEYDLAGNLTKRTDAQGNATTYTYNSRGQALTRTNALGETTHWSYDAKGNPQSITDPAGNTTTLFCDSAGRIASITDPLGHATTLTYDAANRVLSSTTADGAVTTYAYDANGNRISMTDPLGAVTHYAYNSMDKLVTITAPDNSETKFIYDSMGNCTQTIDPLGHTSIYSYDSANRLVGVTDPLGRTMHFALDGNGNKNSVTDPLGRATLTEYDFANRPVKTVAPDGGITSFEYDLVGNPVKLTDPLLHATTWVYDELNRVVKTSDPMSRARLTSYDLAGRVATKTNGRGQVLRYTYDPAGRLSSLDLAGADKITWRYDAVGNPLQGADDDSLVSIIYDSVNRPITVQQLYGTIDYSYDLLGRRTGFTSIAGSIKYNYDALNRLAGLIDPASRNYSFVYDMAGKLVKQVYPNGTYSTLDYDDAAQLTDMVHYRVSGTIMGDNTYLRDAAGNITGWGGSDGNARSFSYDPNDRLSGSASSAISVVPSESFSYDMVGNWTPYASRHHDAANEITEDIAYIYSYDLDGNLIEKTSKTELSDVTTYSWDPLNRLIQVSKGAHVISYRYDVFGRRIARIDDGVEARYVLDGVNVVEEQNAAGGLTAFNLYAGLDQLLMRQDYAANATYWVQTDHLGSVEALADSKGNVVERYRYGSFGQITVMDSAFTVLSTAPKIPFTYTGREWEPEVGMYFYRARYMDPRLGRFISQDPLAFSAGDINIYAYVLNAPINYVDPYGLDVTVTLYEGAHGFGHTGIGVNTSSTEGFYPRDGGGFRVIAGMDVPGIIKSDTAAQIDTITIHTTPEQDKQIQDEIDRAKASPPNYNLQSNNCAQKSADFLNAGGLNVPREKYPRDFFKALQKKYGTGNP